MMHNLMKVKIGIHDYNTNGNNQFDVIALDFHEKFDYSDWTLVNDLMVLTLSRNIDFDRPEVNFFSFKLIKLARKEAMFLQLG